MNRHDLMTAYSVKVNNGSGVLINGMTEKYSYVLTAKHVILENNTVQKIDGVLINVQGVYKHDNVDCAILIVDFQDEIFQKTYNVEYLPDSASLVLVGYPTVRRNTSDEVKHQNGIFIENINKRFILSADGYPSKEITVGMSGGGVYYIENNNAYLIGVQYAMDGTDSEEHFKRLKCNTLDFYDQIVEINNLPPIVPSYLECFSRVNDDIFNFNIANPSNVEKLKLYLNAISENIIKDGLSPYIIMQRYSDKLLLTKGNNYKLKDKDLWIAYCEFLILCLIVDSPQTADENYLNVLDEKRRLLYYDSSENWTRKLQEILLYAQSVYVDKGTLIISSPEPHALLFPHRETLADVIDDISLIPLSGYGNEIDNTYENLYENLVITHLQTLHNHCVSKHEYKYRNLNIREMVDLFRGSYYEIIK